MSEGQFIYYAIIIGFLGPNLGMVLDSKNMSIRVCNSFVKPDLYF